MESSTQRWVAALKRAFPDLPNTLTTDVEKEALDVLSRWFDHVTTLRLQYDQLDRADLPKRLRAEPGKRQVIPVLMSLDDMSNTEIKAWHTLFVCLSAQLAELGSAYWKSQRGQSASMTLDDILNYLPIVFLYVLSSYNPYPKYTKHQNDFSHANDGRVRLITWVYQDARRHISSYLQQHIDTVRQGSGYIHRLRQSIRQIQRDHMAREGHLPARDHLVDQLRETHYGNLVSRTTLIGHVSDLLTPTSTVSIYDSVVDNHDRRMSFEETLEGDYVDVELLYDPGLVLEQDVHDNPGLLSAVRKLLSPHSSESLTFTELFLLGS